MKAHFSSHIEPLEARIAPALTLLNALPDIIAGVGKTGAAIDLSNAFGDASSFHTKVQFTTNFDTDTATVGLQAGVIVLELFDDAAPLTVQNFLQYVNGSGRGDFDGTFFHRSISGFVLQGGGFESTDPEEHIPAGLEVHNEYSASRSNLVGTIAMAKTGLGPNTATSEFFINLGNNSSNLDNQNGGFTVFGKVIAGMDVVNAIAAQPQKDFSGLINSALSNVPVQPSYASTTPSASKLPNPGDFITITDASVVPPAHTGTPAGVTFSLVSITGNATDSSSNVVTGNLTGDSLSLKYAAGKSGVATVKVKASQAGEVDQFDEFQVTVEPNLIAHIASDSLAESLTPNASGKVKVQITNNGAASLSGKVDVSFYLSKVSADDPNGTLFDPAIDKKVGEIKGASVKLASGASKFLNGKIKALPDISSVNAEGNSLQGESYRLIAVVNPNAAGRPAVAELFTDDNSSIDGGLHRFFTLPNLVSEVVSDKLPGALVPGDTGAVTLKLSNNGYTQLAGTADVTFYLSHIDGTGGADPNGLLIDPSVDAKIGVIHNYNVNLATGKSALVTGNLVLPNDLVQSPGDSYRILVSVNSVPPAGSVSPLNEFDPTDNYAASNSAHSLYNAFGSFAGRKNVPLAYTDADGNKVTLVLKGSGYGQILIPSAGELDLALFDTDANSALSSKVTLPLGGAAGAQPHTKLRNVYSQSSSSTTAVVSMGAIALSTADVHGEVQFLGGIKSLALGNLIDSAASASHLIDLGAFAAKASQATSISLGSVTDYGFRSFMPVNSLTAREWIDTNTTDEVIAMVSLKSFSVEENLETSLSANFDFNQVAYSKVKLASFTVGGKLDGATVELGGDVGKAAIGSMISSQFFAGVIATPVESPDYMFAPHSIDSFVIKGAPGSIGILKDSTVAAGTITSISIQSVDGSGSGGANAHGVVAYAIKSYLREQGAGEPVRANNLFSSRTYDPVGNYSVRII